MGGADFLPPQFENKSYTAILKIPILGLIIIMGGTYLTIIIERRNSGPHGHHGNFDWGTTITEVNCELWIW